MVNENNNRGFWSVILISCIPMIIGTIISVVISSAKMVDEIHIKTAILEVKVDNNKELMLSLMAESEKRRTDQYENLCKETQDIKEQLKQKRNIAQNVGKGIYIDPEMELMVKRGAIRSRWVDSLQKHTAINDSLYRELCYNLEFINQKIN